MQGKSKKQQNLENKIQSKKYGVPYARRNELRRGDLKLIQKGTGMAYMTIVHQLDGWRAILPEVQIMADKLADHNKAKLEAIGRIDINNL